VMVQCDDAVPRPRPRGHSTASGSGTRQVECHRHASSEP